MRFNSVSQWLAWQETLNPREIELGLERVRLVHNRLAKTSRQPQVIAVAGTNGKGSSVAMLSSILTAAGRRVGAYTSPHLLRYNERIRLNERDIDDSALCRAFQAVDDARVDIPLTYFEFGTLAALHYFTQSEVDVMVLEVGLGGRLDAVNIMDADVALITSIGIDHTDWLGPDRNSIAREKAGILRAGKPLVCGEIDTPAAILERADHLNCPVDLVQRDFCARQHNDHWSWQGRQRHYDALPVPALSGEHQLHNAACVLAVLERLSNTPQVTEGQVRSGLRLARLAGRLQVIGHSPLQVVDVAHNPQAAETLASQLPQLIGREQTDDGKVYAVFGVLADKDIEGIVAALAPIIAGWHVATLPVARGAKAEQIRQALAAQGISAVHWHDGVDQAYAAALQDATDRDCILACGSFYTVADVLLLRGQ